MIRDDVEVVLLDSLQKRIAFLETVIQECQLKGIKAVHGRAEDIAHMREYREQFDVVTARAVANLATLSELCGAFAKVGGTFICMKADVREELADAANALQEMRLSLVKQEELNLPVENAKRTILLFQKIQQTPQKYPRKAGTPAKSPILNQK